MITAPRGRRLTGGGDDRRLVVFVHGIEDSWHAWRGIAGALGDTWEAVALDLPWRAGNDYGWRWAGSAASWVAAGVRELDRVPDLLVGHSFGANAVLESVAGGQVEAACLAMAMPVYRAPRPLPDWATWTRSRAMFEGQMREAVRASLGGRVAVLGDELVEAMLDKVLARIGLPGFLAVFEQYVASGHLPVATLATPVLIVAGERDPGMSPTRLALLADTLPNATLDCQATFDHFGHVRRAREVAGLLAGFAADPPSRPDAGRERTDP